MTSLIALCLASASQTTLVLNGLDPIDLIAGKEVAGKPNLTSTYLRHEYRFSSVEHRSVFERDPVRYAVANGGACGWMGPMSGKGNPSRFAVVRGRIYLFASDSCKANMTTKPEMFEGSLKLPKGSEEDKSEASAVFKKTLTAHGGSKVRDMKRLSWSVITPYKQGTTQKIWQSHWAIEGKDKFAQWEAWDAGTSFFVMDGKKSAEGYPDSHFPMHPGEQRALAAMFARHPGGLLMGLSGDPISVLGNGRITFRRDDIVSGVELDPKTNRIAAVHFEDHFGGPFRRVSVAYSAYKSFDGVWLPTASRTKIGNGDWSVSTFVAGYGVNGEQARPFTDAFGK